MSAAELVAQLAEAGTPPQLLAAVAKELFTAESERAILADRRRNERERKARSRDVTGQDVTACDTPGTGGDIPAPDKAPPDPPKLTPTHEGSETPRVRKAGSFPCPEGVDPDHWRDFLANRKTKRLTNTPTAYRQQLKALADLADDEWPPGRIVEFAAARGWGAIFDPRTSAQNDRSRTNGLGRHQPDDGLSPTTRAAAAVFGTAGAGVGH